MSPTSYQTAPPRVASLTVPEACRIGPPRALCSFAMMEARQGREEGDASWTSSTGTRRPPPCVDWTVRQLVDHVIDVQRAIPEGLGMAITDGADPQATWTAIRDGAMAVLRKPGVLEQNDEVLRRSGTFGPKVDPPAGADAAVELLCFTGRRP